jgi:multiple sugar transport system permease protein
MVLFALFAFIPIGYSVILSLQEVQIFGGGKWVGRANYTRMINDPIFWQSLKNTAVFTAGTVPTSMAIGLGLAVMLNRAMPGRTILRSVYFLPIVVSGVVVSLAMALIFNGDYGVLNNALGAVGLPRQQWLTSPSLAMVTLVTAVVWHRIGFCMIIYLAALQAIPASLAEASQLDGARPGQHFRHITLPMLRPTTFLLLVLNVIFSLHAFDIIYVLTGGGPGFATTVLLEYIFITGFTNSEMGYASAIGMVLTLILLLFTLVRSQSQRAEERP